MENPAKPVMLARIRLVEDGMREACERERLRQKYHYRLVLVSRIVYGFGWLADWALWITISESFKEKAAFIVVGWLPALFWPLHWMVKFWEYVL